MDRLVDVYLYTDALGVYIFVYLFIYLFLFICLFYLFWLFMFMFIYISEPGTFVDKPWWMVCKNHKNMHHL